MLLKRFHISVELRQLIQLFHHLTIKRTDWTEVLQDLERRSQRSFFIKYGMKLRFSVETIETLVIHGEGEFATFKESRFVKN